MTKPRVSSKIPTFKIEWLLNRMHVSTSNLSIIRDLRKRMKGQNWTKTQRFQAYRYAVWYMDTLRQTYSNVMKGTL